VINAMQKLVTMDNTMHLSSTVMEVWCLKDNEVTSLTFWVHVTWWRQLHSWWCRRGDAVGTAICDV